MRRSPEHEDVEYYTEVYEIENPRMIITARRPILTPEEREKRMDAIARAAERVLLAYWANLDAKAQKEAAEKGQTPKPLGA